MDTDIREMIIRLKNYDDDIVNISANIDRSIIRYDNENAKIYGKNLKEKIQKIMDELIDLDIPPSLQLLVIKYEERLRPIHIYGENVEKYGINIDPEFIYKNNNELDICSENFIKILKDIMYRSMDEYERFSYDIRCIEELSSIDNLFSINDGVIQETNNINIGKINGDPIITGINNGSITNDKSPKDHKNKKKVTIFGIEII